jgi:hypothetical protein
MAMVRPDERVAMAGIHWLGRCTAGTIGPSVSTAVWNAFSATVPFVGGAVIKISYCLALFATFRNVKPEGEDVGNLSASPAAGTPAADARIAGSPAAGSPKRIQTEQGSLPDEEK